jgi:hypothetical protein
MALILDLITELEAAQELGQQRVDGGSDLIDTAQGNSTLMPETMAALQSKLTWEQGQLNLIIAALSALGALSGNGYPVRKVFDAPQSVTEELSLKEKQMADFSAEFMSLDIGADEIIVTERAVDTQVPAPAKKSKRT